jgi:hypothetical protein
MNCPLFSTLETQVTQFGRGKRWERHVISDGTSVVGAALGKWSDYDVVTSE